MHDKVFIYSRDAANADARSYFKRKGYHAVELDRDPETFFDGVALVAPEGTVVVLSHGDGNGPLLVAGTAGPDMTPEQIDRLARLLGEAEASLYLLSCHTGNEPFAGELADTGARFIAPRGYAAFEASSAGVNVYSKEGDRYVGWTANGIEPPSRNTKPLPIP